MGISHVVKHDLEICKIWKHYVPPFVLTPTNMYVRLFLIPL